MSLVQRFMKLSNRGKAWWVLGVIAIFSVIVVLIAGGNYYNDFAHEIASKTNNIVVLPQVKPLPFSLGLDLQGGSYLVYEAHVKNIPEKDRSEALASVRDVIERRVNAFGVSEPVIRVSKGSEGKYRIIAELAGIKDVSKAIKMIGETPILEFKEENTKIALIFSWLILL